MSLEIPKIFYGRYRDVRPRLMRVARRMRRAEPWIPLVEQDGFLDVASTPGYIVGDGPSSLLGADEHFQIWLLWMLARQGRVNDIRDELEIVFQQSLSRSWALLGLVMSRNDGWLWDREHHRPFLRAVLPHWDEFDSIGPRYSLGSRNGESLWDLHNTVMYVLGHQGLPLEEFPAHLTGAELARLMNALGIEIDATRARA